MLWDFIHSTIHLFTDPVTLLIFVSGLLGGMLFGAIPGVNMLTLGAVILPFTAHMSAENAIMLYSVIYCAGVFGGAITAILFNIPGAPENAPTALDGYPLTQKGQAGKAVGAAVLCSALGGFASALLMIIATPLIASWAVRQFGPPEVFALIFFGLTVAASVGAKTLWKGWLSVLLGLLIATVGTDPAGGYARFSFGTYYLLAGVSFIPMVLGFFAISEVFIQGEKMVTGTRKAPKVSLDFPSFAEFWRLKIAVLRSMVIGFFAGILPGIGAVLAAFMSYSVAVRWSRHPEKFGTGELEGVVASETANNAATGAAMIPLLALGLPGGALTAMMLGVKPEIVRIVFTRGSGCYGINGADTVSYDAALLSQEVARPVRVQLSRQDEMAWENFGAAYVIDQRIGIDQTGSILAWDYEAWTPSLGGRPGYDRPGNVVTGMLAGFEPARVAARAADAPSGFLNNFNSAPSYVTGCVGGMCGGTGAVRSERVLTHTVSSPFFTGPLRSPARLQNTFAHECFLDEVAAHVKADPVAYRLRHLSDPRLREVVSAAAKASGWDARPSPRPGLSRTGLARGRGIACVLYEGDNGYCALVIEVEVDQATGRVRVTRMVASQDCGPISNPDGMRSQLEGGALQGLSRALGEEVTWDAQKVTSVDWRSYRSLPLGFDVPVIESVLINRSSGEAMGAGETAITLSAAALGNAIFDATGARVRQVPMTPERIKGALEERH